MRTTWTRIGLVLAIAVVLSGCAAEGNEYAGHGPDQAGFWLGLWQGLIVPVTFLVSLFDPDVGIYEVHNNGNWYDFGFVLGVSTVFGSIGRSGAAAAAATSSARRPTRKR